MVKKIILAAIALFAILQLTGCKDSINDRVLVEVPVIHTQKWQEPEPIDNIHLAQMETILSSEVYSFNNIKAFNDATLAVVNHEVNKIPYVSDVGDDWKQPSRFFKEGGDCEDYVITKFAYIRDIFHVRGRMFIVFDKYHNAMHAILLYGDYVLDNQHELRTYEESLTQYFYLTEIDTAL